MSKTEDAVTRTSSSAMRFCTSRAILESRYRTSFSSTKFFLDCDEILDLRSRSAFCALNMSAIATAQGIERHTAREVVFDFKFARVRIHRQVQRCHGIALGCARGASPIVRGARVLSADHGQIRRRRRGGCPRWRMECCDRHSKLRMLLLLLKRCGCGLGHGGRASERRRSATVTGLFGCVSGQLKQEEKERGGRTKAEPKCERKRLGGAQCNIRPVSV